MFSPWMGEHIDEIELWSLGIKGKQFQSIHFCPQCKIDSYIIQFTQSNAYCVICAFSHLICCQIVSYYIYIFKLFYKKNIGKNDQHVFEGELCFISAAQPSCSCSRCLILFWFFTSGLFTFEEFIEKLKAKVKALCAV